ncbi:trimeric intracellular cation channel family protein [Egicoccus halophilus]|uniref:Glycine transporter domain-containing protein n=1 Tax=Egicoccus halophilus TaxID=1670830 RepID=A0A8J3A581_9ACTN|nr:TRIC cation channel family protein [Egicoccus halophilus]GGI03154.1 hypothetical protein GCM10011354_02800 [Egicoccus halophilus]
MEQALVYLGTVTFAVTGALAAVRKRFDVVGVVVLATVTAVGGGSIRDVVAGIVPPASLRDETLLWLVVASGLAVFALHRFVPTGRTLYVFDTISLGLFAALGAERGVAVDFGFWGTVFAGAVSGVGGGVIRDVLTGEVPGVLYRSGDFYATAAAAGAAVSYLLQPAGATVALVAGAVVTVGVRVGSRLVGLELPVPRTEA